MATATSHPESTGGISARALTKWGLVALVLSLVSNWLITFGAISVAVAPELDPLQYGPVGFLTTVGAVGATVTYGIVSRVASAPDRMFTIIAVIVLVISLIPDFVFIPNQPGGTLTAGLILGIMHVTTAIICIGIFTNVRYRQSNAS